MDFCQNSVPVQVSRKERFHKELAQVMAWLKSFGMKVTASLDEDIDADVATKTGDVLQVAVGESRYCTDSGVLVIPASALSGTDDEYRAAIHEITQAAGYGQPTMQFRADVDHSRKTTPTDDPEWLGLRASEARRIPNHPELNLWRYEIAFLTKHLIEKTSESVLIRAGMERSDIEVFVAFWTNTFLGRYYRHHVPRADNVRLLGNNVRQRYSNLIKKPDSVLGRKQLNIDSGDKTVAEIALYGRVTTSNGRRSTGHGVDDSHKSVKDDYRGTGHYGARQSGLSDGVTSFRDVEDGAQILGTLRGDITDAELMHLRHEKQAPERSASLRRRQAQAALSELAESSSCERIMEIFENNGLLKSSAMGQEEFSKYQRMAHDVITLETAKRFLREHRQSCATCQKVDHSAEDNTPLTPEMQVPVVHTTEIDSAVESFEEVTLATAAGPKPRKPSTRVRVDTLPEAQAIRTLESEFRATMPATKSCACCKETKSTQEFGVFWRKNLKNPHWAMQAFCKVCRKNVANRTKPVKHLAASETFSSETQPDTAQLFEIG